MLKPNQIWLGCYDDEISLCVQDRVFKVVSGKKIVLSAHLSEVDVWKWLNGMQSSTYNYFQKTI